MQQKNVLILTVVTAVALGAAAMTLRDKGSTSTPPAETLLFPELNAHINELAELRVEKSGKTATLRKEGGQWRLTDRGGYPAKFETVKELAMRVADLRITEAKTTKKANHNKLGVEWPAPPAIPEEPSEVEAGLVTLKDASGKELASLVVGKSEWLGSKPKVYARRTNEDQVYLCSPRGSLDVMPEAKNWIEAKFIELANDRVQDVSIEHTDGERVELGRSAENHTQFSIKNLEPGKTERYAGVANGVAQALGYGLQLEDVRAVTEVDFTKEPLAKTRFRTVDGLELLLESAKFEDKTWVKVSAAFTPPPEPEQAAEPAAPAEGEAKPEGEATTAEEKPTEEKKDVGKEAADLNQRLAPWAFEIPSYKSDVLLRRMKDLLTEPEPPAEDDGLQGALENLGIPMEEEAGTPVELAPAPADEGNAPSEEKPE
jgi:hypothetical protein